MDWLTPDMVKAIIAGVCTGSGLYAGIRADLRGMAARITAAHEAANHANDRIDRHLEGHA